MTNEMKRSSTITKKATPQNKSRRIQHNQKNNTQNKQFNIYRTRLIPIWLRFVIVLTLLLLAGMFGLMIGYGVIGDGEPLDALKWGTYQHILDIMDGKE